MCWSSDWLSRITEVRRNAFFTENREQRRLCSHRSLMISPCVVAIKSNCINSATMLFDFISERLTSREMMSATLPQNNDDDAQSTVSITWMQTRHRGDGLSTDRLIRRRVKTLLKWHDDLAGRVRCSSSSLGKRLESDLFSDECVVESKAPSTRLSFSLFSHCSQLICSIRWWTIPMVCLFFILLTEWQRDLRGHSIHTKWRKCSNTSSINQSIVRMSTVRRDPFNCRKICHWSSKMRWRRWTTTDINISFKSFSVNVKRRIWWWLAVVCGMCKPIITFPMFIRTARSSVRSQFLDFSIINGGEIDENTSMDRKIDTNASTSTQNTREWRQTRDFVQQESTRQKQRRNDSCFSNRTRWRETNWKHSKGRRERERLARTMNPWKRNKQTNGRMQCAEKARGEPVRFLAKALAKFLFIFLQQL